MEKSLLFIPDITGFTRFVNETEIDHSQHIIQELIDVMLEANTIELEVAEVEGDAIFFYKKDRVSFEVLRNQAKKVFLAFHTHLKLYENQRICNCGACSSAVSLKLKFVVHAGPLGFVSYGDRKPKPHGKEVVAIHRLLKNDIEKPEYVLYSENYLEMEDERSWVDTLKLNPGLIRDKELGPIGFQFEDIEEWNGEVEEPILQLFQQKDFSTIEQSINISQDIDKTYQIVSDFKYRSLWNRDADEFKFDENEINRIGTEHLCVVDGKNILFETTSLRLEDNPYVYGEKIKSNSPFKEVANYFILEKNPDDSIKVTLQFRITPGNLFKRLIVPLIKGKIQKQLTKTLNNLKEVCESSDLRIVA